MTETLLPPNRGAYEDAADKAGVRAVALPVPIADLASPGAAPPPFLPWLAWGRSVDLWRSEWPTEKKRSVVAGAAAWHRIKGTRAALEQGVALMGARVGRVMVPPGITHLTKGLTDTEREAFLSMFAQLRVYPFVARGRAFVWVRHLGDTAFLGPVSAVRSKWGREAFLWDKGAATPLTTRSVKMEAAGRFAATEWDEVVLAAKPTRALHLNAAPSASPFLIDDIGVRQRLVHIPRGAGYKLRLPRERFTTLMPAGDFIDVQPALIAEPHPKQERACYPGADGVRIAGACLPPSIAWRHIFERWHLHDPERVPDVRRRGTHLGRARLGMPAFHAEAKVAIRGRRGWRIAGPHVSGYLCAASRAALADARAGARAALAARDRLGIDTITNRPLRAGDRAKVGRARVGEIIEV